MSFYTLDSIASSSHYYSTFATLNSKFYCQDNDEVFQRVYAVYCTVLRVNSTLHETTHEMSFTDEEVE